LIRQAPDTAQELTKTTVIRMQKMKVAANGTQITGSFTIPNFFQAAGFPNPQEIGEYKLVVITGDTGTAMEKAITIQGL